MNIFFYLIFFFLLIEMSTHSTFYTLTFKNVKGFALLSWENKSYTCNFNIAFVNNKLAIEKLINWLTQMIIPIHVNEGQIKIA